MAPVSVADDAPNKGDEEDVMKVDGGATEGSNMAVPSLVPAEDKGKVNAAASADVEDSEGKQVGSISDTKSLEKNPKSYALYLNKRWERFAL